MGIGAQAHMLWVVLHYLNAPIPAGWLVTFEEDGRVVYNNPQLKMTIPSHPLLSAYRDSVSRR